MAVIDSGVGAPGGSSSILEINNLAAAQSEVNQMLVGYTRNIFNNTPSKPQAIYSEGDEIVFDFPSSRDFLNIPGSQFMFDLKIYWKECEANERESSIGVSIAHIFDRLQVFNGSVKVEHIDEYGKYVFHEFKSKTVAGGEYLAHGYFGGIFPYTNGITHIYRNAANLPHSSCLMSDLVYPSSGAGVNKEVMVRVIFPVKTLFERSGYLPIGNIFKGLQFRFKIASHLNFAWLSKVTDGGASPDYRTGENGKYFEITNPVWKMDSLRYSLGSMPAMGEHVFHTFGTRVNRLAIETYANARYILDYNWSSLKRCVSFVDPAKNEKIGYRLAANSTGSVLQLVVPWGQGYWCAGDNYEYWYDAGTVRYPEEDPVSDLRSGWYHYLKSVHMQDIAGDFSDTCGGINRDVDIANNYAFGVFAAGVYMCAKFDKLDQSGSIISGTDVSNRYVILNVDMEPDAIYHDVTGYGKGADFDNDVEAERYVICNYDVFIILYGGAIAIQD